MRTLRSFAPFAVAAVLAACTSSTPTVEQAPSNRKQGTSDDEKQEKARERVRERAGENDEKIGDDATDSGYVDPLNDGIVDPGTTEVPPATPSSFSEGTGGPKGAGQATSGSGLQYKYDVPQDNQAGAKGHGLLVLLHGSGASNYNNFVGMMSQVASQYGLIRVSVLAPNGSGWNEGGEVQAAEKLHQLVQNDLFTKYNIDKSKIYFSGQSSGGGFLASNFVAAHAKDYQGGAFMLCGAQAPQGSFTADAATIANFKLHFEITTNDGIWTTSLPQAVAKYQQAGMQITQDNTKPGGHCNFDQQQVILAHIGNM